jgi:hypothetical protein
MGCEIFGRRCLWRGSFVKGTSSRAFLGWKSKGIAEEVEERCLASVASSNNENAIPSVRRGRGEILYLLIWCGILPSSDSPRAIDRTDSATSIAVSTTVCHAFGSCIRIVIGW